MPGFDGMGPGGMGPRTGGGRGFCPPGIGGYPYGYPQQPAQPGSYPYGKPVPPTQMGYPPTQMGYPTYYGRPRWGLRFGGRGRGGRGPWGW